jgi:NADPH:quinone reductase
MRVVQVTQFGGPAVLKLRRAPEPVPGPREMVVDVDVAEVLFLDTQLRGGWGREYFDLQPPYVPGVGVAGTVSEIGAAVDGRWVGRRVVAGLSEPGFYRGGGYAERAVAAADAVVEVPDELDLRFAIAALHDGVMAESRLEKAQLGDGDVVLITAAGGAIGNWLIPLAARAGARVVAAARGTDKLRVSRERGAHLAVDYSKDDWIHRIRAEIGQRPVDVVFDGAGGASGAAAMTLTHRGSRFFSYGSASGAFAGIEAEAEKRGVVVLGIDDEFTAADQRRYVKSALARLAAGDIRPVIGQVVPLDRAAEAHAAIEGRSVVGKTLLVAHTSDEPAR